MREIKFRGKVTGTPTFWAHGYYGYKLEGEKHYIMHEIINANCPSYFMDTEVKPETVGQFTGLKDKNGVDIYEGDIVTHAKETNRSSKCTMVGGDEVIWDELEVRFILGKGDVWGMIYKAYEVIGNIHEK